MDKESVTTTIIVVIAVIIVGLLSLMKSEQNTYKEPSWDNITTYDYDTTKNNDKYDYDTTKNSDTSNYESTYKSNDNYKNQYNNDSNTTTNTNVEDKLLKSLLTNNNYTNLPTTNIKFYKKYQSLDYIIYSYNINDYSDLNNELIKSAVFNNISEPLIKNITKNNDELNGYVSKAFINNRLRTLFNNNVEVNTSNNTFNDYNYIKIANTVYKNVNITNYSDTQYKVSLKTDEYNRNNPPRTYPFPMKITNVKQFSDYILVTSKAVYLQQGVLQNNQWKLWVYDKANPAKTKGAKSLGEVYVNLEAFCTVDIEKYIEQASTIYTIFKRDGNNYYFYKNFINN